jgi:hypothetical protein
MTLKGDQCESVFWALALKASIGAATRLATSKDLRGWKDLIFLFIFQLRGFVIDLS